MSKIAQSVLFIAAALLVAAVTILNSLQVRDATNYFNDAQQVLERESELLSQAEAYFAHAQHVTQLARVFYQERDQARQIASKLYGELMGAVQTMQEMSAYIHQLEEALKAAEIELPKPDYGTPNDVPEELKNMKPPFEDDSLPQLNVFEEPVNSET